MKVHAGLVILCCLSAVHSACQPVRAPSAGNQPPGVIISESAAPQRIQAVPGLPLMLTLGAESPQVRSGASVLSARLSDGRALGTQVYNITIQSPSEPSASPALRAWLADPYLGKEWISKALTASPSTLLKEVGLPADSLRVAKIDIPRDSLGPSLWIDDKPVAVQWLVDPESLVPAQPEYWPPMLPAPAATDTQLMQCLRDLARSPLQRWRVRLLIDGLLTLQPDPTKVGVLSDPIAEAMAQQVEQRWRLALARLAQVDLAMATRVKQRLCLVAALPGPGGGMQWVPAWPVDDVSIDRLRGDLADPRLSRGDLVAKSHQWLREQPQGAAWIVDDGGELSRPAGNSTSRARVQLSGQRPVVFVGITNLSDRAETVAATFGDQEVDPQYIQPLDAGQSRIIFAAPSPRSPAGFDNVSIQLGRFNGTIPAASGLARAEPPAFIAAGLQQDLTLATWLYGSNLTELPQSISGVNVRVSRAVLEDDSTSPWRLRIEWPLSMRDKPVQPESLDLVELHIGPSSAPIAIIAIDPSGNAVRKDVTELQGPIQRGRSEVLEGASAVIYDLPSAWIEEGNILRLGLVHTSSVGVRSCWPRARLPWQSTPGRFAIDLNAWSGLTPRD
jgi:hypothetical protein